MSLLYGRLVERFGFREVREVSNVEVHDFLRYRSEPQDDEQDGPFDVASGGEITVEQYETMVARMKANAATFGKAKAHG